MTRSLTVAPSDAPGGQRRPRIRSVPAAYSTAGPEACYLLRSTGQIPDPWQEDATDDILAEGPDGRWAARRTYTVVARQNGKGGIIEPIELYGMFVLHEVILHSAHLFDTARDAFMRILGLVEGTPDLARRIKRVNMAHGKEGIELLPPAGVQRGGALYFHARTKGGGRGKSPQRLVLDEGFALTREHMAALLPAISAQDDPHVNVFSTPPPVGEPCEVLMSVRAQVLHALSKGLTSEVAWLEWGAERDADVTDPRTWAQANPAYGIRITERGCRDELAALGAAEFGVERCGIWPVMGEAQWLVISEADWTAAGDPTTDRGDGRPAFCLEMSPDRSWAAICGAWVRPDGLRQVEVLDLHEGTGWLAGRIAALNEHRPCAWVIARDSPAGSEVAAMEKAGIEVVRMSGPDANAGSGMLYDGIAGTLPDDPDTPTPRTVRHGSQEQVAAAMAAAVRRPPGQKAWAWDRARPGAYLLLGLTGALWGLATRGHLAEQPFFATYR